MSMRIALLFLVSVLATSTVSWAEEAPSSTPEVERVTWRVTNFGRIELTGKTGTVEKPEIVAYYGGTTRRRIIGRVEGNKVIGHWVRDMSMTRCATEMDGSAYWGRVELDPQASGKVFGGFGYCDAPPEVQIFGRVEEKE